MVSKIIFGLTVNLSLIWLFSFVSHVALDYICTINETVVLD